MRCAGGNEIEGERDYFREILVFLLFSGLLEMSEKVTVCLATHFIAWCLCCGQEAQTARL